MAEAKSFEEAFEELENAVTALEDEQLTLDEAFMLYSSGVKLVKFCNDAIDRIEKKMIELETAGEEDEL